MNGAPPLALTDARLLDPESGLDAPGSLLIAEGRIADLGPGLFADGVPDGMAQIPCRGFCLAPGLIDSRVQLREPGFEHQETIASAAASAAAGGVSAMICLPNTNPVIDDVSVVEFVARRAREVKGPKVTCHAALTKGLAGQEITEIGLLSAAGAVAFSDGERALANPRTLQRALSYARAFDALLIQHAEDPDLAAGGAMNQGELATRLGLQGIPVLAESLMVARDTRILAASGGGRLHFAHLSCAEAIAVVRRAREAGLDVSCDVAAHHFALNESALADYRTFAKVTPPLRAEEDRLAVIAGLKDGSVEIIASDHSPHDQDSKRLPFARAASGMIGLQTLLGLALELYHDGHLGLLEVLATMTCNPARRFRLDGGRLLKGAAADLLLFDPDLGWQVREEDMLSKSKNTAFDGRRLKGKALLTMVDGRTVYCADAGFRPDGAGAA